MIASLQLSPAVMIASLQLCLGYDDCFTSIVSRV